MENYEKKYKEALERARQVHTTNVYENKKSTEYIFPELKESEDERIKREILELVSISGNGNQFEEIKDWLEKQKEENFIDKNLVKKEAHRIAWEYSKHYDPLLSKESWCEMAALDMACWLEKHGGQILANSTKTCKDEQNHTWSEEDEIIYNEILDFFLGDVETRCTTIDKQRHFGYWLKSLKPHWKPSEKQMKELQCAAFGQLYIADVLASLYEDLQKL